MIITNMEGRKGRIEKRWILYIGINGVEYTNEKYL